MYLNCVACEQPAQVIYKGTTYCRPHFEQIWKHETGMKKVGDENNWGKSLVELKNGEKKT